MSISATAVRFDEDTMWVDLTDGRKLGVPLAWFPRLLRATPEQRGRVELSRVGLHWEGIDEDISVAGLLAGHAQHAHGFPHAMAVGAGVDAKWRVCFACSPNIWRTGASTWRIPASMSFAFFLARNFIAISK
jgi:hypothetical protein